MSGYLRHLLNAIAAAWVVVFGIAGIALAAIGAMAALQWLANRMPPANQPWAMLAIVAAAFLLGFIYFRRESSR